MIKNVIISKMLAKENAMTRYHVEPEKDEEGQETGRYLVVDSDGNIVGVFDSEKEAWDWIRDNENEPAGPGGPRDPDPSPSPGF